MPQFESYIESCTIHDDNHLVFNELHESNQTTQNPSKSFEYANGFSYTNGNDYRFIIWRIIGNRLDLIELSLVNNLNGNAKHIYFNNSTIIPSLYISKYESSIQVLVTTTSSLYRLIFPITLNDQENSIFHNISSNDLFYDDRNQYQISLQSSDYSSNYLTPNGDAYFSFTTQSKSICCVKLPSINSINSQPVKVEVNQPNIMKKIMGLMRSTQETQSIIVSYKLVYVNDSIYLISLCQDLKMKIWNLKTSELVIEDLQKYSKSNEIINWDECRIDAKSIDNYQAASVIICLKTKDDFHIIAFNIKPTDGQAAIKQRLLKKFNKNGKLIDMFISNKSVWTMHKNDRDEIDLSCTHLIDDYGNCDVIVQKQSDKDDEIQPFKDMDLKETYMKLIFEPYKYSKSTICKALSIMRQSILKDEVPDSIELLKEIIIQSIENEVKSYPNIQNCTEEEEFLDINCKCWSKFYSILLQYDYDSKSPLGLFVDSKQHFIILIRKNAVSLFTKSDLAQIYESKRSIQAESLKSYFSDDVANDRDFKDMQILLSTIKIVNDSLANYTNNLDESYIDDNSQFKQDTIDLLTQKLKTDNEELCNQVIYELNRMTHQDQLLRLLKLLIDNFKTSVIPSNENTMDCFDTNSDSMVNSEFTLNSLLACYKNLVFSRYNFLRSLCILVNIVINHSDKLMSNGALYEVKQKFLPTLTQFYNGYEFLKWLVDIYPYPIHKLSLEKNLRRLSDLLDHLSLNRNAILTIKDYDQVLLKSFIQTFAKDLINSSNITLISTNWFPVMMEDLLKLTWPTNGNYDLIKYFMYNVQYIHLNNYCMLIKWWNEGESLRKFILGHCCLFCDEIDKSVDLFIKASVNIERNEILKNFLYQNLDTKSNLSLKYYTKIIHYYDLNGNIDAVIDLIEKSILSCDSASNRSKLYCILFKSYMDLEYYQKAFDALMSNTDYDWKLNCLKQFVIELCNQNKASFLIDFNYADMQLYVKEILHKRAQNSDLRTHDYYSILYSFFLKNHDYLKAAACMYEYAIRLKRELTGLNSLLKQEKCYLACLNSLKLVPIEYAWICMPNKIVNKRYERLENTSFKGQQIDDDNYDNNDQNSSDIGNQQTGDCIIEYDEINRNYLIVHYITKISLLSANQSAIVTYYSVDELIGLLIKHGLFDDAIILCLAFKTLDSSPLLPVFNGLVDRCCNVTTATTLDEFELEYEWLKHNESLPVSIVPYENPSSLKWKLLQIYLERYNDYVYYKAVCKRILTLGFEIPNYIICSFKKVNSSALLQIYINFGLLEEACDLCIDYIEALLTNSGIDRFDIKNTLETGPVILPYTSIDQLLMSLKQSQDENFLQLYDKLQVKLDIYFDRVRSKTESKLKMKRIR